MALSYPHQEWYNDAGIRVCFDYLTALVGGRMMAHLSLSLLGPFEASLAGEPVTGFESDKVRALCAYLAVEAHRPHRRDSLAGLLWPDWSDRAARSNLRNALANLRTAIGDRRAAPSFLLITRETIQFNTASDHWLDVAAFSAWVEADPPAAHELEEAVALYRGGFLEGFFVKDSPAFEDWSLLTRERLLRQALAAFDWLVKYYEQRGEYEQARDYAWRQVELEPWQEEAHRQLMRLLALSGQRSAALAQYETCCRLLAEELGVEPAEETTRLYEQIRDGDLKAPMPSALRAAVPAFLHAEAEAVEVERPVFVARRRELARLDEFLDLALAGQGRVVYVTGEAGSGKTALTQEFARRAQDAHEMLLVADGSCNAYTGSGDPYLPFREILGLLTGGVEARWEAGAISRGHARRLWNAIPLAAQALVEAGPNLIDTLVPGRDLVARAMAYPRGGMDWLDRLEELVNREAHGPGAPSLQQTELFDQYTRVLLALARQEPLVLVLDDLQWADTGSINLLFHLGRQVAGSRILIVGAYREEEVALGRDGRRHPLEPVVNELRRDFGDIMVNVGQAASRDFVEDFLDTEPNQLGTAFREALHQQTRGHPLFTVELLRGMQQRGDLIQDQGGQWVEGPALDWETLPPRVEAVIAERIGRLAEPLQAALRTASVEGEVFTAEVVARVRVVDDREMVACLSGELDRRHRLLRAQGIRRIDDQCLSYYRFRHILFQKYLYNSLDPVERAHLHEAVGRTLEALHEQQTEAIAAIAGQLAWHFQEAGLVAKAIGYLRQAGDRAVRLSANEEAITLFNRAVALLETLPETPERLEQELSLQLNLTAPLEATRGYTAPETGRAYTRAYEICQQIGETPQLHPALVSLGVYYYAQGEVQKSLKLTERSLRLAQRMEDPLMVATSRWLLGVYLLNMGELRAALEHLEYVIAFYDPEEHAGLAFTMAQDPGVSALAWASQTLWLLGYPDQALERSREALALAHELDHPYTLGFALCMAGAFFHQMRREDQLARERNEAMLQLSTEEGFPLFLAGGTVLQGWTLARAGQPEAGIRDIHQGLTTAQAMGTELQRSHVLALLAEAQASAGQTEEGLGALAEALALAEKTGERYYEAEIHRLVGELLLMQGSEAEAETSFQEAESCFQHAIEVARRQQARSWELRATTSLARLWQKQGRQEEARKVLAEIYEWFTEGFDTPDLIDAGALLDELTQAVRDQH
jgi:DNA-binding SARP family transcriptional activator/predicted ATPase